MVSVGYLFHFFQGTLGVKTRYEAHLSEVIPFVVHVFSPSFFHITPIIPSALSALV